MANLMLGFPNVIDTASLSGGAWLPSLPLTHLQSRQIGRVARSTDCAPESTWFLVGLVRSTKIRVLGLVHHNLSVAAGLRLVAAMDPDFAAIVYDSGRIDAWPQVYPDGVLEWEDDSFWDAKYTDEQRNGYTWSCVHVLPTDTIARYWRLEIDDPDNSNGHVSLGRVFLGPAWQPDTNMDYGEELGWESQTDVQEAWSGAEYFRVRTPYRVQRFELKWMPQAEAFARAFDLTRQAGIHNELLYIADPDDTVHALRRQFLGRLRKLTPLEHPMFDEYEMAYEIKELL